MIEDTIADECRGPKPKWWITYPSGGNPFKGLLAPVEKALQERGWKVRQSLHNGDEALLRIGWWTDENDAPK